jgi:hypothetical protein
MPYTGQKPNMKHYLKNIYLNSNYWKMEQNCYLDKNSGAREETNARYWRFRKE